MIQSAFNETLSSDTGEAKAFQDALDRKAKISGNCKPKLTKETSCKENFG